MVYVDRGVDQVRVVPVALTDRIDLAVAAVMAFAAGLTVAPGPQLLVFDDEPAA